MMFPTTKEEILRRVHAVNPQEYARTRNYVDGAVTRLSPYISRGVISTKEVLDYLISERHHYHDVSKLVEELAWRDYWQTIWKAKSETINQDLKKPQEAVRVRGIPVAIMKGETGIIAVDQGIRGLYERGYVHNHNRLYIASLACNFANCHWLLPAKWMYYHLLDGDWGSNALSWQWVAGTNSVKRYFMNQQNINTFCHTTQRNTFLDRSYEDFPLDEIPDVLIETGPLNLFTRLPSTPVPVLDRNKPLLIYNYYNLSFTWRSEMDANRVLLLEPSVFLKYPVSDMCLRFVSKLSNHVIGLKVFTGEFNELASAYGGREIYFKEHPFNASYRGIQDQRDWMFPGGGEEYPSFSAFWKKNITVVREMFG